MPLQGHRESNAESAEARCRVMRLRRPVVQLRYGAGARWQRRSVIHPALFHQPGAERQELFIRRIAGLDAVDEALGVLPRWAGHALRSRHVLDCDVATIAR